MFPPLEQVMAPRTLGPARYCPTDALFTSARVAPLMLCAECQSSMPMDSTARRNDS